MALDAESRWPDRERTREFFDMVRAARPPQYVCFEYHGGKTELTTKALQKATQSLADSIQVLLAVDLEHSVVIASSALSAIDDTTAQMIADQGFVTFFWEMSKTYPNQVAMVRIDRKGEVSFDPSFHPLT